MCTRYREYGYCYDAVGEPNIVCQKKHWKVGVHRAKCAALVAAGSSVQVAEEVERAMAQASRRAKDMMWTVLHP